MTPNEIKALVEAEFPELVCEPRRNPNGWSFFYGDVQRGPNSTRIARAVQASKHSPTMFKKAVTARQDHSTQAEIAITGGAAQVRDLIRREIELYHRGN